MKNRFLLVAMKIASLPRVLTVSTVIALLFISLGSAAIISNTGKTGTPSQKVTLASNNRTNVNALSSTVNDSTAATDTSAASDAVKKQTNKNTAPKTSPLATNGVDFAISGADNLRLSHFSRGEDCPKITVQSSGEKLNYTVSGLTGINIIYSQNGFNTYTTEPVQLSLCSANTVNGGTYMINVNGYPQTGQPVSHPITITVVPSYFTSFANSIVVMSGSSSPNPSVTARALITTSAGYNGDIEYTIVDGSVCGFIISNAQQSQSQSDLYETFTFSPTKTCVSGTYTVNLQASDNNGINRSLALQIIVN